MQEAMVASSSRDRLQLQLYVGEAETLHEANFALQRRT